jgi:lysine 6-dehydrogenase
MKIAVLGAGMVGRTIAEDLSKTHEVTSFDVNEPNLAIVQKRANVKTQQANLQLYDEYKNWFAAFEFIVIAVPGFMGFNALKSIIELGKNVADISFFPEDGLALHELAVKNNVTAIIDCGVAPGMSNLILGYENSQMQVHSFDCMVGGLPKKREKPFEYKAPFSPIDVIEEYTRPARYVENGNIITKPALSDAEFVNISPVGTLESFNTDGLRSIMFTMKHIPNMKEKTLRYPSHIQLMQALIQAGFFSEDEITVNGTNIKPIDFTNKILFNSWKLNPTDVEFTVMKIDIAGAQNNIPLNISYLLYDEYDAATQTASMSRTTGYACNAFAHLIMENKFSQKGVFPPELVGGDAHCFDFVMSYLKDRNVVYKKTTN